MIVNDVWRTTKGKGSFHGFSLNFRLLINVHQIIWISYINSIIQDFLIYMCDVYVQDEE